MADSGEDALAAAGDVRPGRHPHRRAHAEDGRPRSARRPQGQAAPGDGHRHERLRQRRPRHRGHEGRRLRLHPEALQGRRDRAGAAQGRGARGAAPREPRAQARRSSKENHFEAILAKSPQMLAIFKTVAKIADYKTTVLITGESGTGKELVARAIHSPLLAQGAPFIAVNCGAIPENLLESELFGHKKGAFTDANADRRGLFEEATGGTLLPRRDRRAAAEPPGEAAPRPPGGAHPPPGRHEGHEGRRPHHRRHAPRPHRRGEGRALPRGPLLPHQRAPHPHPAAPRAARGRAPAHRPLRRPQQRAPRYEHPRRLDRGAQASSSSTAGRATCASWRTPSSAPWSSPRATCSRWGTCPSASATRSDPVQLHLASGELSIKKTTAAIEEILIRRALQKTKGNRTRAAELLEISHRALLYKIKDYKITDL